MESERDRAHRAWRNAERIKKLSDNLVRIGPWGLGLDGVLAWVPIAGTVYSLGSGALLLYEGVQAHASSWTLTRMAAYMIANSAMSDVPIVGWAMDTVFRGQAMAANALQKDIVARHGRPETVVDAPSWRSVARPAR
ncbi:MAG TPA: DUF4112 domain-containing protein [Phenylobacterium sp.]|jgi:hypothetical protein|uniref:DUF4112 domain-containing protein n=1 Tax=Phenylobacterium sp. TaxID=1871053 RepID=UPI002D27813F|nr:DUF4112 domain-containing protein [Phenylobacterium sp.]HZZ68886.1 DUF4112 domain-containing protein [Phenylobacterium sp.]